MKFINLFLIGPEWITHAPPSTSSSSMDTAPSTVYWQANRSNDQVVHRGLGMYQSEPSSLNFQPNRSEDHVSIHEISAGRVAGLHAITPYVIPLPAPPHGGSNSSDSDDPPTYESVVGSNYHRE